MSLIRMALLNTSGSLRSSAGGFQQICRALGYLCAALFLCGLILLTGCASQALMPTSHLPKPVRPPKDVPTYNEVVERHNAQVLPLGRLWMRADVKLRWLDEGDRLNREQGEGKLIIARDVNGTGQNGVALTLGKLGQTAFWAGSDGRRYWLFDLRGPGNVRVGTIGHESIDLLDTVPPDAVPLLMGVLPVEPLAVDEPVRLVEGHYVLRPQIDAVMLLDPKTYVPVRVMLLDRRGIEAVVSHLDRYRPVALPLDADSALPVLPTRVDLYAVAADLHVRLKLSGATDQKIRPDVFDFDVLMKTHKPVEVIDLDVTIKARVVE